VGHAILNPHSGSQAGQHCSTLCGGVPGEVVQPSRGSTVVSCFRTTSVIIPAPPCFIRLHAFRPPPPLPSSHLPPSTRLSWLLRTADTDIHFLYALTRTTSPRYLFTNSYSFTHILVQQAVLPILSFPTLILVQQSVLLIP